ncbi:MAG: type II toxin-antitoxin system RelE/ParE family toxin [Spirochaetales bacterium]|uniref:Type II toxin-antitoxin system RelE/ParE family toxin n=1 Tax=Candidatus Thalassospirochaeta sargassi TaxID=3119039 RepID=A0AAJ1IH80_9SPIO|nr:type II toxin-antitoxin system RelE/ParE family toxin [Spirochaetales bacterium]
MNVEFSKAAELEFKEVIDYYNNQSEGLGFEFANEVRKTIERITGYVNSWPKISDNTRRARTNRFPYGIIYSNNEEKITIIAVMHLHRKPDYWKSHLN